LTALAMKFAATLIGGNTSFTSVVSLVKTLEAPNSFCFVEASCVLSSSAWGQMCRADVCGAQLRSSLLFLVPSSFHQVPAPGIGREDNHSSPG